MVVRVFSHIYHMHVSFEKAAWWVIFTVNWTRLRTMRTYLRDRIYEGVSRKFSQSREDLSWIWNLPSRGADLKAESKLNPSNQLPLLPDCRQAATRSFTLLLPGLPQCSERTLKPQPEIILCFLKFLLSTIFSQQWVKQFVQTSSNILPFFFHQKYVFLPRSIKTTLYITGTFGCVYDLQTFSSYLLLFFFRRFWLRCHMWNLLSVPK